MSPRLKSRLLAALSLAVFGFALWVLSDSLGQVRWAEVRAHLLGLPGWRLAAALACVAGSYWMLSYYDLLAVRLVGSRLPYAQVGPISFSAYAVGHNLGFSALSGGALRLRAYSRLGLSAAQIAGIAALCAITFALGVNLVLDAALLLQTAQAARILHLAEPWVRAIAVVNLALLLGYLWLTAGRAGRPFRLGGASLVAPGWSQAAGQLAVSVADLACSAAALYLLMPALPDVGYIAFLGLYALAMAAAIASSVPGGLGVFESVLLLALPAAPKSELLGAALAFRALYYLLPLMLALAWLAMAELRRWRGLSAT